MRLKLILLIAALPALVNAQGFRKSASSFGGLVPADTSTNMVQTKAEVINQVNFLRPIQFAVDSASTLASDTTWVFQNLTGVTLTIDSIHVAASSDDYAISIVKCDYKGTGGTLVDAVTASNNGTSRLFYQTETTITSATLTNGQRLGFKKPASTGDAIYVRVHYH